MGGAPSTMVDAPGGMMREMGETPSTNGRRLMGDIVNVGTPQVEQFAIENRR